MQEAKATQEELDFLKTLDDPKSKLTKEEVETEYIRLYRDPSSQHEYGTWRKIDQAIISKWGLNYANQLSLRAKPN